MNHYYIYILTNHSGTLYIGVTNDLERRLFEHKNGLVDGFTKRYRLSKLIYYEISDSIESAIIREKQLKHWNREWKVDLIKTMNPSFDDLYAHL